MNFTANIGAVRAGRVLEESSNHLNKALTRLASGTRLVSPEDDSAGLVVSEKLSAESTRNHAVQNNLASAMSYSQTQEGFLGKITKALDRMGELAALALDNTKSASDKNQYQTEFADLKSYISDIGTKDFNGVSLFNGSGIAVTKDSEGESWTLEAQDINGEDLAFILDGSVTVTNAGALTLIDGKSTTYIDNALESVLETRAAIGSNITRIGLTQEKVVTFNENLTATVSRIRDVDVADESARFAKYNILVQSGAAMVAQANLLPQNALRLIS